MYVWTYIETNLNRENQQNNITNETLGRDS